MSAEEVVKTYSEDEVEEILQKLVEMGYGEDSSAINDLTLQQLDEYVHGRTN